MSFISYAQNLEDVMLWRALKHVDKGFYIDVGAAWPNEDSVTRSFYERGWNGINIEPNPFLYRELSQQRPRDINLNIAVGMTTGPADFALSRETGLSTLDQSAARAIQKAGHEVETVQVLVVPLSEIWRNHVPQMQEVHFLKVDVEGLEYQVIASNDWKKYRPWVVVVESTSPGSQSETHEQWEDKLLSNDYCFSYADGLNRFYVAAEKSEVRSNLRYPPNVFDGFVSRVQAAAESNLDSAVLHNAQLTNQLNAIYRTFLWALTKRFFEAEIKLRKYLGDRRQ
jgi:FkbM family methyltransferase